MIENLEVPAQWGLPGCFLKAGIMVDIAMISQVVLACDKFPNNLHFRKHHLVIFST